MRTTKQHRERIPNIEEFLEIFRLYKHGSTVNQIAEAMDLFPWRVRKVVKGFKSAVKKSDSVIVTGDTVHFGSKRESYYENEDDYGKLPEYKAHNRHLMTPIRKDWQLYTTNTEQ